MAMIIKKKKRVLGRLVTQACELADEVAGHGDPAAFIGLGLATAKNFLDHYKQPNKELFMTLMDDFFEIQLEKVAEEGRRAGLHS
jgi:hypothetical protein